MKKIALVIILILVLAVATFLFIGKKVVEAPINEDLNTTTNVASSTEPVATSTTDTKPVVRAVAKPSIAVSPYSVYLGFAMEVGTSTASLMDKEVGEAVVGYEWEALPESQLFGSVVLPLFDESESGSDRKYTVSAFDEETKKYITMGEYTSGEEIDFPRDQLIGPNKFKVTGIPASLKICPGDRSLNWVVRFTFNGRLGLVRTPITEKLKAGETCEMR